MSNLTTRAGKGSPLTNNELDANFTNLNADKVEIGGDLSGTSSAPSVAKIQGRAVSADAPAIGEKLVWNGTAWEPSTEPTGEPIGHEDKSASSISFNSGTRTFTIAPVSANFVVWCKGVKYTYTSAQTVVIPDTTGLHFIYFNASGVLSTQMSYFTWEEHAPTAYVYWNSTTQQAVYFGDERHGITLDWQTHEYLHRTRGAAIASGFGASGYTTTGAGATDADAQIDIGGGTFFDEDLQVDIVSTNTPVAGTWQQDLSGPARIPVLYLNGSSWVIDAPTDFPFKVVSGVPQYNLYSGGTWSSAPVANNGYFVSWILATHNLTYPVIAVISQAATNQVSEAEAMTFEGLTLSGFPSVEFRPLYKVIYQHKTSFANNIKASTIAVYDLRSISAAGVAAALVQDHGNLSGLGDDDHAQYLHVSAVRSPSAAVTNSFLPSQASQSGKYLTTDGSNPSWGSIPSGSLTFTGDVTGTGTTGSSTTLTLSNSGAAAGTYTKVTVDAKGRVTTGASINSSDVTTALGFTPENSGNKGVANGYASLDGSGKVPSTQLPSYVDDVIEYANLAAFPATGESGKIYIAIDTAKTYRWSGSAYVEISASPGSTDAVTEGSTNLYFTNARARGAITATGSLSYNNQTGVLSYTQPTNVSTFTNDSGYLTGITGTQVATALGYTPPQPNGTGATGTWSISISGNAATVSSITSGQVTTALGYTPYNSTNPSGYITSASLTWANISSKPIESAVFDASVNSSTYWTVVRPNGSAISNPYVYRITLVTTGTGTDTGEVFLLSNVDSLGWVVKTVARDASGSNRPYVFLDGGVPKVKNDHASLYNTRIMVEEFNAVSTGGLPTVFGLEGNFSHDQGTPKYRSTWNGSDNTLLHSGNYNSYALPLVGGIVTGAVSLTADAQGYASPTLYVRGDIRAQRGTGGSGVIYFGNSSGTYLYYDGANYFMPNGQLDVNGSRVLNAGNYNSYAVPLTGGTMTGTLNINATDGLKVTYPTNDGDAWYRGFGIESNRGAFYLRPTANNTQTLFIGYSAGSQGWNTVRVDTSSFLQNGHVVLNANNYNSYAPTLTGTGASGSWGISITGSSASTTGNAATATTLQTARNINGTSFNGSANITTASWGTARTLTIGATGKSVDGSGNVSWTLGEIGAVGSGNTMTINAEYSGTVAQNQTGWYTIASYGSGRAEATFHLSDQDSSRHNYVRANIVWSYGYGGIVVDTSGRHGVSTIRNIRLLYNTSDRTYGGVKVQVYCEGTSDQAWTLRVRQETTTTSGWGNFTEVTPVLEGTPAGWAEGYQAYYVNEQGQISTSSSSAYFAGNLALHAGNYSSYALPLSGGTLTGDVGIGSGFNGFNSISGTERTIYIANSNAASLYLHSTGGSGRKYALFSGASGGLAIYDVNAGAYRLQLDTSAANFSVALQQGGNQVLHAGNYSSYALPLSGGTLTGTVYVSTSGSGSSTRALRVGPSGGSPGSFGSYSGSWRSTIEIWDNAATRMLHLTPPDGTNYNYSSIKSTDAGLKIDVGANGGTNAVTIETTGAVTLTSNLTMSSGGIGSNAWSAASANETSRILAPAGAAASWDNNPVGAIKIRLPFRYNNAMWRMTVKIYDYGASVSEYHIGTYSYLDGGYQSAAYFIGSNNAPVRNVRFGNDGSYDCVWIGETNTVWSYPVVAVTDFSSGFRTSAASNFMNNWHISYVTSFGTVAQNLNPFVRLASGSNIDGNTILHAGNYTSYSPSLTGSGASGTWGINVTGTAGSISGYNNPTAAATANTIVYRDSGGDISGRYFFGVHFNQSSSNTENPSIAAFWTNSGSDNYNRKSSPAHVISQLGLLTTSNYGSYALPLTGGTVSGIVTARGFDGYGVGTNSGTSGDSYRWGYQEAGAWTHPYPDLVFGYHTGLKFGANTGYGGMRFYSDHPNISSTILFSIGNGDSHVRVANNLIVSGDSTGNEVYTNNWFRNNGSGGWYSQSYGYGLRFAEGEGATYGNVCTYGGGRNGWAGYGVTTSFYLMGRSGTDLGIYDLSYGWTMYTPYGSGRMSFGTSSGDASYRIYCSGSFYATGNVVAYSDRRVKENIVTIDGALDKVSRMRGVYYNRIDDEKKTRQVGVVAQEMNEVLPEAVTYGADVDEYGVSYGNIVGVLIEAIKELKSEVADLKSKLH